MFWFIISYIFFFHDLFRFYFFFLSSPLPTMTVCFVEGGQFFFLSFFRDVVMSRLPTWLPFCLAFFLNFLKTFLRAVLLVVVRSLLWRLPLTCFFLGGGRQRTAVRLRHFSRKKGFFFGKTHMWTERRRGIPTRLVLAISDIITWLFSVYPFCFLQK